MTESESPIYEKRYYGARQPGGHDDEKLSKLFEGRMVRREFWEGKILKTIQYAVVHPRYQMAHVLMTAEFIEPEPEDLPEPKTYRAHCVRREIVDDGLTPVKAIMELVRYSTLMSRALGAGAPAGTRPETEDDYAGLAQGWEDAKAEDPDLRQQDYAKATGVSVRTLQRAITRATKKGPDL
jgi:hypothetical protein